MGQLEDFVREEYRHREEVVRSHFAAEAPRLARACHAMAERFARGGRILAFGLGAAATDASHISVEFVHPVIVGKRALPAIALPNDGPTSLGLAAEDTASVFARQIDALGLPEDIAIGLVLSPDDPSEPAVAAGIKQAAAKGMMTIALAGPYVGPGSHVRAREADWLFTCDDRDPFVVQEVHETGYHMLWELVHVFFEHKGLLVGRDAGPVHDAGASGFLYPFLAEAETNLDAVLSEVQGSVLKKAEDVIEIRAAGARADPTNLATTARVMAERFAAGGKLLAFGKPGDMAFAISTSGGSRNVLAALEEARRRKMTCFGLAGYGGGPMVARGLVDHCITIDYEYIPRIQEAQASEYHILRRLIEMI